MPRRKQATPMPRRMETAEPFIPSAQAKVLSDIRCPWGANHLMHIYWGHAWWHPEVFHKSWVDAEGVKWWQNRYLKPDEVLPPSGSRIDELCKTTKQMAYVD